MKCIKLSSGKIDRISDDRAFALVNHGSAVFIPKSIWKNEVRKTVQKETVVEETATEEKVKSSESVKGKKRKTLKTN